MIPLDAVAPDNATGTVQLPGLCTAEELPPPMPEPGVTDGRWRARD